MTSGRVPATAPAVSIIVPAHNEASVIGRLLDTIPRVIRQGNVEIVVACNGCIDETAAIALKHEAIVVEIPESSKIAALNAGDRAAAGYPRIYLDADIALSKMAIEDMVDALTASRALCVAPPLRVDLTGRHLGIRAYFLAWQELPYIRDSYVGSGVYALSAEGRERFAQFPDVVADDLFVRNVFRRDERTTVVTDPFVIQAPRTLSSLIRRRIRIEIGNLKLRRHPDFRSLPGSCERSRSLWFLLSRKPRLIPAAVWYLAINAVAKVISRVRIRSQQPVSWARDETTRVPDA